MKRVLGLALLSVFFLFGCGKDSKTQDNPPPVTTGNTVKLVLFGAPWCVNCRKELTDLNNNFKSFDRASRVSTLVYVTSGDTPGKKPSAAIATKYKADLGLAFDATADAWRCQTYTKLVGDASCILPAAVVLDQDDKVLKVFSDSYSADDVMVELKARLK